MQLIVLLLTVFLLIAFVTYNTSTSVSCSGLDCLFQSSGIVTKSSAGGDKSKNTITVSSSSSSSSLRRQLPHKNDDDDDDDNDRPAEVDLEHVQFARQDALQRPDVFLIGSMKAGTSSFYQLLVENGQICEYGEKEKHFFIGKEYRTDYEANVASYIKEFSGCNSTQLTLDATPGYTGSKYPLVIARMKEHFTASTMAKKKLIYIIREPVSRLFSEYNMAIRLCLDLEKDLQRNRTTLAEQEDFMYRLERHTRSCERVMDKRSFRHFEATNEHAAGTVTTGNFTIKISLDDLLTFHDWCLTDFGLQEALRGNYRAILKAYLTGFLRRDQLFLVNFDTLIVNATSTARGLERFLDLESSWSNRVKLPLPMRDQLGAPKAPTILDCTTVMMLNRYYKVANGEQSAFIELLNKGLGKRHPAEPLFVDFADPFSKCTTVNRTEKDYPPKTWQFVDLALKAGEEEAELVAKEAEKDAKQRARKDKKKAARNETAEAAAAATAAGDDDDEEEKERHNRGRLATTLGERRSRGRRLVHNAKKEKKSKEERERIREEENLKALGQLSAALHAQEAAPTTTLPHVDAAKPFAYDFIFGWSTGHVGTTTLSEKRLYGSPDNVTFIHEMKYGRVGVPLGDFVYGTERYQKGNYSAEYDYVKSRYVPWLLLSRGNHSRTLLDLGHNINYFAPALIDYLENETSYTFAFVRLRRERLEAALSLTFSHPDELLNDICTDLITRFCPMDRPEDILLKPPSGGVWQNFTNIQKALWLEDETEARWRQLKANHPKLAFIEILWGKAWDNSLERGAIKVGSLFGITKIVTWDPTWPHMDQHVHAGDASTDKFVMFDIALADRAYQSAMNFTYIPA